MFYFDSICCISSVRLKPCDPQRCILFFMWVCMLVLELSGYIVCVFMFIFAKVYITWQVSKVFHEKAVQRRWCLSPVLKCSVGTLGALCIHCVRCPSENVLFSWKHLELAREINNQKKHPKTKISRQTINNL